MTGRIDHIEVFCPVCDAKGWCPECSGLGTREAYEMTQVLQEAAAKDEHGIAAQVLDDIETWPFHPPRRPIIVEVLLLGAFAQIAKGA